MDYKVCTRAIVGPLLHVIHHVGAPDQMCGVPSRFDSENVALLQDVGDYANELNLPVAISSLDQEKAFDRLEWPFPFATLSRLGFGPSFIRWGMLFYTDIRSAILVNGYASPSFRPSRGIHQGCPLSPLLYVSTMEAHPFIAGLLVPRSPKPLPVLSLYADNTSVIV